MSEWWGKPFYCKQCRHGKGKCRCDAWFPWFSWESYYEELWERSYIDRAWLGVAREFEVRVTE